MTSQLSTNIFCRLAVLCKSVFQDLIKIFSSTEEDIKLCMHIIFSKEIIEGCKKSPFEIKVPLLGEDLLLCQFKNILVYCMLSSLSFSTLLSVS